MGADGEFSRGVQEIPRSGCPMGFELRVAVRDRSQRRWRIGCIDSVQAGAADQPSEPLVTTLTQRQREVLQLVAEGKGTKAIASILNISVKTVEFHKFRIMSELDLHSTAELIKYAIAEGLVSVS